MTISLVGEMAPKAAPEVPTPQVAVSLIMPAYNEEAHIIDAVLSARSKMDSLGYEYEIVVVDDGSDDGTFREVLKLTDNKRVKAIGYHRNQGKGYAIMCGAWQARGEALVFIDSDSEINPNLIERYVRSLRHADIALGSKKHPESVVHSHPLRKFLSLGFNAIVRIMTGTRFSDTQSGFKACRASAMRRMIPLLSVRKYAFDVELLTVAHLLRLKAVELPIQIELRSLFSVRAMTRMFVDLLGITYRLRVIRWYQKNLHNREAKYKPRIRW